MLADPNLSLWHSRVTIADMAAFLTHLVVGERVWARLVDGGPGSGNGWILRDEEYGTFLFGCLAPDVDKICPGLDQGTTHFLPKDEEHHHLWHRSESFLERRSDFLRAPYRRLAPKEQAFVLGYLCHIATDEITARAALLVRAYHSAVGTPLPHVDAVLTALESRFWRMAADSQQVAIALEGASIPEDALPIVPVVCWSAWQQIVLPQVREGAGLMPYLNTVRRQWQWVRQGRITGQADDPELEADLVVYRRQIENDLPASEKLADEMELELFVEEAVRHSQRRIEVLLAEEMVW
jgi:hypothetical protein